jgi:lipid II:glycine glycyltransferase (peptidoglycan interpeptide bridge formation enzyme)
LVKDNTASGIMQSLHWREMKRCQGLLSFHLGIYRNDELIGGAIFYAARKSNGAGILVAPEGPVLPWDDEPVAREALRLIIDTAQDYAAELGALALRIEPRLSPPPVKILREFVRGPLDLVPKDTLYVDLCPSAETLLAGMKPKGRYNIKLSRRHGVRVVEDKSAAAVGRFYPIIREASVRDSFALEPYGFFENMAEILCQRGCARFLFAEHEGDTLGTLMLITYGKRATYLYGGIADKKRNLMGGYALQWAALEAARQAGCSTYDFYGFDAFRSREHPYARFSQFKSQFGGEVRKFIGAQDYFFMQNVADAFVKVINEAGLQPIAENV